MVNAIAAKKALRNVLHSSYSTTFNEHYAITQGFLFTRTAFHAVCIPIGSRIVLRIVMRITNELRPSAARVAGPLVFHLSHQPDDGRAPHGEWGVQISGRNPLCILFVTD